MPWEVAQWLLKGCLFRNLDGVPPHWSSHLFEVFPCKEKNWSKKRRKINNWEKFWHWGYLSFNVNCIAQIIYSRSHLMRNAWDNIDIFYCRLWYFRKNLSMVYDIFEVSLQTPEETQVILSGVFVNSYLCFSFFLRNLRSRRLKQRFLFDLYLNTLFSFVIFLV